MKTYILAYTIRDTSNDVWTYEDGWEVHEDLESAQKEYQLLLEREDLYSACIAEGIEGTDI